VNHRIDLGEGAYLIIGPANGRIFGPFVPGMPPIDWIAPDDTIGWNRGGERVWIAPECIFNYSDPTRILETYRVDPKLDPGAWDYDASRHILTCHASPQPIGRTEPVELCITRRILPHEGTITDQLTELRYSQLLQVSAPAEAMPTFVPWLIRQISPGSTVRLSSAMSYRGSAVFGTPPDNAVTPHQGEWKVDFVGPGFFKTSYGRDAIGSGSLSCTRHNLAILWKPVLVEAKRYPEYLPDRPESAGQFASIFYDEGRFGHYGEMELYGHLDEKRVGCLEVETTVLFGDEHAVSERLTELQKTRMTSVTTS
jgi:hypothetical protein